MDEAIFPEGFMPKGGSENTKKTVLLRRFASAIATVYRVLIAIIFFSARLGNGAYLLFSSQHLHH
jgi:hypothetical protein